MKKAVILTGLRANNDLHIGNYFGAMLPLIDMAQQRAGEFQVNLFVPDLHSFTTPIDHSQLRNQIQHNLRLFVAGGLPLDNADIHIYRQSRVAAHSELTIILNCFTGFGEMSRMTQFKDKSAKIGGDRISVGLFDYPVLMAADILLYGARYVPVGDDQSQHLEYVRDIAERMNNQFGQLFLVPESTTQQSQFFGQEQALRIKDLQNPLKKMSKSDDSSKGVIFLGDDPAKAAEKIMAAETDNLARVSYNPIQQPGISNLLQILALLRRQAVETVAAEFSQQNQYGDFKRLVAQTMATFLTDFQAQLKQVDEAKLNQALEASEIAMNHQANRVLTAVQTAVGLR